ncbi:MAG: hypothetical protein AAFZ63_14885 [Bacteroidota bacterium]
MIRIKILDTLALFDESQTERLRQFVNADYFNNTYHAEQLKSLLGVLLKLSPETFDKQKLHQQFFPEREFVERKKNAIDNLLTALNGLVEQFIVYEQLQPVIADKSTWAKARYFSQNGKEERLWPLISTYRKQWDRSTPKGFQDFHDRFVMEELAAEFSGIFKAHQKDNGLEVAIRYLDKFFLAQRTKLILTRTYQERVLGKASNAPAQRDYLGEAIIDHYPQLTHLHSGLSDAYYQAAKVVEDMDNVTELDRFEDILDECSAELPHEDLRNLYVFYRACRGRQYQVNGQVTMVPEFLAMYKSHLNKGVLTIDGKLFASTLKLLVNVGVKAADFTWVRTLLRQYPPGKIIGTRYPEEFHRLCLAEVLFAEGQYDAAVDEITYKLFEDFNYSLSCDILLIKIYAETDSQLLESRVRAMELKVRRAKIKDFDRKAYLAFISLVRQLNKYLWLKNEKKLARVREKLQSKMPLIQREWLEQWLSSVDK